MTGHSFRTTAAVEAALQFRVVHGYRRAFRLAGSGSPLVLIHGIGDSSATWIPVLGALAPRHLVIAPDPLGHGHSAKPRADYSVAAYANGVRDLLGVLGVERATLVGQWLGGGVALPGSALEVFDEAGHFPFHTDPQRSVAVVEDFLAMTRPARWSAEQWRQLLRAPVDPGGPPTRPSATRPDGGAPVWGTTVQACQLQPLVEPQPSQR